MYKEKTPILISMPRNGSHYVATYLRRHYHISGLLYPLNDTYSLELFNDVRGRNINSKIELFESLRNVFNLDMFNIFHGAHLMQYVTMPSRPNIHILFDWFKEFYSGYQIVLLRRRNIWKTYLSWLFHSTIKNKLKNEENMTTHPWHGMENKLNEDILKSTIESIKPDFVHNELIWQYFIKDVVLFNEKICNYYLNDYNKVLVRDWWLEDLTEDMLEGNYAYKSDDSEMLIQNTKFKPTSIKYESYFSLSELHTIKTKFNEVYETTFKPYGYLVD